MSESETIWLATDDKGECNCFWDGRPTKDKGVYCTNSGKWSRYDGHNKPPPGECVAYRLIQDADIDTDGEPIGWKIVGIGKDGSVLCEKPNGQRRRYSFGEQPSGEAWERLLNVVADYARNSGLVGPRGEKVKDAWKAYEAASADEPARPKIVCLCGSTRFAKEFAEANERETLAGNIVLSVGCFRRVAPDGQREPMEESVKVALDVLHKRKIDLADEVLVLNVGGYIGDSTRSEIEHAGKTGKRVRYLEPGRTPTDEPPLPASTDEPPESQIDQQATIEQLTKERDEARAEVANAVSRAEQFQREAEAELANERASGNQVIAERDATIAELQAKLERPEMPECVRELCNIAEDAESFQVDRRQAVAAVEAHYAPPDGHEWQPVDDEHPITVEDVGRKVAHRNGGVSTVDRVSGSMVYVGCCPFFTDGRQERGVEHYVDITRILRPIDQPFKFEVGGIYVREPYGHDELELLKILDDRMLFYLRSYSEVAWTDSKGETNGWKIIRRVR